MVSLKSRLLLSNAPNIGTSFTVLNYHRVLPINSFWNDQVLDVVAFELQLRQLKRFFTVLPLKQALKLAETGKAPLNTVVITIDDGFSDCFDYIFPLLQQYQLAATFFISTHGLKHGYLWENQIANAILQASDSITSFHLQGQIHSIADKTSRYQAIMAITDTIKYLPMHQRNILITELVSQIGLPDMRHEFVTPEQLKQMADAGMTIGAHTMHHPILAVETLETALEEIVQSKHFLEQILGINVHYFAYPNGKFTRDFNEQHVRMVAENGFDAAFCTDWGQARPISECRFRLKRFTPWDRNPWLFSIRLALHIIAERFSIRFLKQWIGTHGN